MQEDPKNRPEFNALMGLMLGLAGIFGAILWFVSGDSVNSALVAIVAIVSVVIFVLSIITILALLKASRDN